VYSPGIHCPPFLRFPHWGLDPTACTTLRRGRNTLILDWNFTSQSGGAMSSCSIFSDFGLTVRLMTSVIPNRGSNMRHFTATTFRNNYSPNTSICRYPEFPVPRGVSLPYLGFHYFTAGRN